MPFSYWIKNSTRGENKYTFLVIVAQKSTSRKKKANQLRKEMNKNIGAWHTSNGEGHEDTILTHTAQ